MPAKDWLIIDATIDNTVALKIVGGDSHAVELGLHIREVGGRKLVITRDTARGRGLTPCRRSP